MKKILFLSITILLLTCSCGKFDINKAKDEFKNTVNSSKGYELKGTMEIYNNEDTFKYNIIVNYQKEDKYKVSMINQNNNHEQIILKNEDSVYVVTPSLNKSFKFESQWPDNSSQSYILSSLVNDVMNDQEAKLNEKNNKYIIQAKVNYPHNKSLEYQELTFDKSMNLERVVVYDNQKSQKIRVNIDSIDYKAKYKDNYFDLDTLIDEDIENKKDATSNSNNKQQSTAENNNSANTNTNVNCENDNSCNTKSSEEKNNTSKNDTTTSALNDIIYPLYVPSNTYLKSKDKIEDEQTDRTILTFNGDKSFILVEEAANVSKEFEIIPVNGDPLLLTDSIAALSDNSISWVANNVEYYITSSNLSSNELMTIAESMGVASLGK